MAVKDIVKKFKLYRVLKYHLKSNICVFLISLSLYIIEIACYISGSINNFKIYSKMPEYEVFSITDHDRNIYGTVAASQTYKDCERYGNPYEVKDLANSLNNNGLRDYLIAIVCLYVACWLFCTVIDISGRVKNFQKINKSQR
jgi:hypothetical protein